MTNLEAKQEAIKKAYGEYWELVKDYVDENGWIFWSDKNPIGIYNNRYLEYKDENPNYWRPESLQGIENNNGWIKIESEADLPNDEDAIYWALKNSKAVCIELKTPINLKELFSDFLKDKITHYQLIEQPKPPIF